MDEKLSKLLQAIFDNHEDEPPGGITCDGCCDEFASLVEMVVNGAELSVLLPAVETHLRCCRSCREEYEALLCIVRAEYQGLLPTVPQESQEE